MSDSAKLIRQWTLLRSLSARRQGATLKELAADAAVSQKTISRDLNLLRRLAFPIEEFVGEHGRKHWKMADASGLAGLSFTHEEAAALYLGRQNHFQNPLSVMNIQARVTKPTKISSRYS